MFPLYSSGFESRWIYDTNLTSIDSRPLYANTVGPKRKRCDRQGKKIVITQKLTPILIQKQECKERKPTCINILLAIKSTLLFAVPTMVRYHYCPLYYLQMYMILMCYYLKEEYIRQLKR